MEKQTITNKHVVGISVAIGFFLSIFIVFSFAPPVDLLFVLPLALLFSITGGFLGNVNLPFFIPRISRQTQAC